MKKEYKKPIVVFENFSLSANIAAGCEVKTWLPTNNQCGMNASGLFVFMEGMNGCSDIKVSPGESFNGICYHTPSDSNNLFNS